MKHTWEDLRSHVTRGDVLGLVASCLLVILAFSPVIFGGKTLSSAGKDVAGVNGVLPFPGQPPVDYEDDYRPDQGASTWAFEPWAEVNDQSYSNGEIPLWNPYQALGAPQAANMQSAAFDPLLLPVNLHATPLTWDLAIIGAFILGAAAAFIFARVLGLEVLASLTASAAFSLTGYFFMYSNNHFARAYIYLPIVFLFVELTVRSRRLLWVFGLGISIAGSILVGMPEATACVLIAAAVFAVFRVVVVRRDGLAGEVLLRLGGAVAFGLLLTAPMLLLFQQYEALSFNTHKADAGNGTQDEATRLVLNWIVPFFSGERPAHTYAGVHGWVGGAVAALALVGIAGRRETKKRHAWLFFGIAAFLVLKTFGFGLVNFVGMLPVLERIKFPTFAVPVLAFAVAILAGIGVQVLAKRDLKLKRFLIFFGIACAAFLAIALTDGNWGRLTTPPGRHILGVWGRAGLGVLGVLGAVFLTLKRRPHWAAIVACGVVILELLSLAPRNIYAQRADPFRRPGWMSHVDAVLADQPRDRVFAYNGVLFPNTSSAYQLQDIRALDALYVDRYWRFVKTFLAPEVETRFIGGPYAAEETRSMPLAGNDMFDALAVRALISQDPLRRSILERENLRLEGTDDDTYVYENLDAYPRAWVVHRAHRVDDEDAAFGFMEERGHHEHDRLVLDDFDPRREAVVEVPDGEKAPDIAALDPADPACDGEADEVEVVRYEPREAELSVDAECAGLLVLPDTYFPGWSATVDGRDATIHPTDGAFRGVAVPTGTSRVVFTYDPARFQVGLALALVGLVGFGTVAIVLVLRRRGAVARASDSQSE